MPETWAQQIRAGSCFTISPTQTMTLRNAALAHYVDDTEGRTSIRLCYKTRLGEIQQPILCTLICNKVEQCLLKAKLYQGMSYELEALGRNDIYLLGDIDDSREITPISNSIEVASNAAPGPSSGERMTSSPKATASSSVSDRPIESIQSLLHHDKSKGTGPPVKAGDRVSVLFISRVGHLAGKVISQSNKGNPYHFKVGEPSVIKGFSRGVLGMQVGGERIIYIPSHLAFARRAPKNCPVGIDQNSSVVIECSLIGIGH